MRKGLLLCLVLCLSLLCGSALAQTLNFDSIYATCELPDEAIVLTPDNLSRHPEWIAGMGTTEEELLADFTERGVLAQAWETDKSALIEITAVQDDWAQKYFDVDQQDSTMRGSFRKAHLNGSYYGEESNLKVLEAEWKKTTQYGRFLMLKYKQTLSEEQIIRGFARKTLRNGYSIQVDRQVFNRPLKNTDQRAIDNVMASWHFTSVLNLPITLSNSVSFSAVPPSETSTGKFNIEGTCDPGLRLIAVVLRMSSATPTVMETSANSKGKFAFNVKLPEEGIWLITVTAMNGTEEVGEYVMNTVTYQKTLLSVNFDDCGLDMVSDLEQQITGDTLTISGTTIGQVSVQCLVDGGETFSKQVKTNNSGKFSFKLNTTAEGPYRITLVFTKKHYNTRRFVINGVRNVTQADLNARARATAVKPAYATLVKKISGYIGKTMTYKLYTVNVQQAGDEWLLTMALKQSKANGYSDLMIVHCTEDPNISVDSVHTFYGICKGMYTIESEEETHSYPEFDLVFFEN